MKKRLLLLSGSMLLLVTLATAQTFELPQNIKLASKEDYTSYEKNIIEAANWLEQTPLTEQKEKRREVERFIFSWISGSPAVNVDIYENLLGFDKKNPGMMILYMAGTARYVLEHNYSKDKTAKLEAGLRSMIKVYKGGINIKRDKQLERLAKADQDGKIKEWIAENIKTES